MDEAEIAAALAAKANPDPTPDVETPQEPEKPAEPKNEDESFHDNLPLENTLEKMQLLDYFQVPQISRHSAEVQTWMNTVIEWARGEAGSREYTDVLRVINDQERIMGSKLKPDRLSRLAQYVKINSLRRQLIEKERALYG